MTTLNDYLIKRALVVNPLYFDNHVMQPVESKNIVAYFRNIANNKLAETTRRRIDAYDRGFLTPDYDKTRPNYGMRGKLNNY